MKYQTTPKPNRAARRRSRHQGVTLVIAALSLTVLIAATGFVVDMGNLYMAKAQAQKAADAAALAGSWAWGDAGSNTGNIVARARAAAVIYARANGYDINGPNNVTVTSDINPAVPRADLAGSSLHQATVARDVKLYFMPFLGFQSRRISARAMARFISDVGIPVTDAANYGRAPNQTNMSVFGPLGQYSFGDPYSPKYLDDGSVNPLYDPKGYKFNINVPASFTGSAFSVDIFDPGTHNANGNYVSYDTVNKKPLQIDEIRPPTTAVSALPEASGAPQLTTTKYTLTYTDPSTGAVTTIATAQYGDEDSGTDMHWVTPGGFSFDPRTYGGSGVAKTFQLQVQSISGSSENGFELRAGVPGTADADYATNGTSVEGVGRIPMNFNTDYVLPITLANIPAPPTPNPFNVLVKKFDTDVGAVDVNYMVSSNPSNMPTGGYAGKLAGNGQFLEDTVVVPGDYTAGQWTANYHAGAGDTSVWEVHSSIPTGSGYVQLVQ